MGTYINGLRCMPYYPPVPLYVDFVYANSNSFIPITSDMKAFVLSGISGGGGAGIGGVHNTATEPAFSKSEPPSAGGAGAGYIETTNKITTTDLLSYVGDTTFVSGYEYGLKLEVGAGGSAGINWNQGDGAQGGYTKISIIKRNASSKAIINEVNLRNIAGGWGSYKAGGVSTNATTKQITIWAASSGAAGGYGGRGGRAAWHNYNAINVNYTQGNPDGVNGQSEYVGADGFLVKKYLFDDPNAEKKYILGKSGASGRNNTYAALQGQGFDTAAGETAYGAGGNGGNSVGIANNILNSTGTCAGTSGQSGVIGLRIFYR